MPNSFVGGHARFASQAPSSKDRVDHFRSLYRIGERVAGIFSHWEGKGLGWVNFQCGPLLARMESHPEPGTRLQFLVQQLFPEIVLQEIFAKDKPGILSILQRFWAGQSRLETHLGQLTSLSNPKRLNVQKMAAAFRHIVENQPELGREFADLTILLRAINEELEQRGLGHFFCLPWLANHVRGAGLLLPASKSGIAASNSQTPAEVQFVCAHPVLGHMEIHFALVQKPVGFMLYLERTEMESSLKPWLEHWFLRIKLKRLAFLGTKPLAGGLRSGILARLLLPWEPGTAGLHVQV